MISYATVPIGTGGIAGCSLCGPRPQAAPFPLDEIVARLDALPAKPSHDGVSFTGFEAFLHPELPRLISSAVEHGFDRVMIGTDGHSLAHGGNAAGAISAGVTHIELTLLAGDASAHDRIRAAEGAFAAARAGARSFVAAAGSSAILSGVVPLCRHSAGHAPAAVAALAEMGVVAVRLDATALKRSEQNSAFVAAALETATVNRVAGFVIGWDDIVPVAYRTAPWTLEEAS